MQVDSQKDLRACNRYPEKTNQLTLEWNNSQYMIRYTLLVVLIVKQETKGPNSMARVRNKSANTCNE